VGTPDQVAQKMLDLHRAGADGLALSFVDYHDGLRRLEDELLPRLERLAQATWTACSNGANADMVETIAGVHVEHEEPVAPPAAAHA
jgi:hypothetical protein